MTLNKKRCLIFLAVILILLLGVTMTTAATVQKDNNTQAIKDNGKLSTPANNDVDKAVQSSASITSKDAKEKNKNTTTQTTNTENKQITKKTETNKKSLPNIITSYGDLSDLLRTTTETELIIDLQGSDDDFKSTGRIEVSNELKNLTINGNDKTIDGQESESFLEIKSINLTLSNIIVKNCSDNSVGGAVIYAQDSNITINNSIFEDNYGGDGCYGGVLIIEQNDGTASLITNNCSFKNNRVDYYGGAIYSQYAEVFINNSTFIENYAYYSGGAISSEGGNVFINNSTFLTNSADDDAGAIYSEEATFFINDSVFIENEATTGGALSCGDATFFINNSMFRENIASNGGAIYGYNLELTRCNFTSNRVDENGGAIFYLLNLAVDDCNFIENHADSYGGAIVDMGERYYPDLIGYTTINNSRFIKNTADKDGGAILEYATRSEYDEAVIDDPTTGNYILIKNSEFTENEAQGTGGVINLQNGFNTTIERSNFTNNTANKAGVIFVNNNGLNLSIVSSNFFGNNASTDGGVIYVKSNNVLIQDSSIENYNATGKGGFIYLDSYSNLTINNSNFTNQPSEDSSTQCIGYGGVIYQEKNSNITINNSNFKNNKAYIFGGVIYQKEHGMIMVSSSNFTNNELIKKTSATYDGGAIYQEDYGILNISNSSFKENKARYGASIYQDGKGNMFINDSLFSNNHAYNNGGVYQYGGIILINNSYFNENIADNQGGAIFQYDDSEMTILNSNFTSNTAKSGGAIQNRQSKSLIIIGCNFTSNIATNNGGAIKATNDLELYNCTFKGNKGSSGGAVVVDCQIVVDGSEFIENQGTSGGAISQPTDYQRPSNIIINNTNFTKNRGTSYGAAIYTASKHGGISVENSNFKDNSGDQNGLIYINNGKENNFTNCNFTNNSVTKTGLISSLNAQNTINITNSNIINNSGGDGIVNSYGKAILVDNTFDSNWVNNNNAYVLKFNNTDAKVVNNTFINNTNNRRDMLINILVDEIHDNEYINNYLNDTMDVVDMTVSEDVNKNITIDLRNVYNDTIRNGTLNVSISGKSGVYASIDVVNGNATLNIPYTDLQANENTVTLKYITLEKHYQNITQTFKLNKATINSNITVSANETVKVGQTVRINGTLTSDDADKTPVDEATIELYINGTLKDTTQTNDRGEYEFNYITPNIGLQNVTVIFTGKGVIESSSNKTSFTVLPRNTNMTIENNETIFIGQDITVSGILYDELGDRVSNTTVEIRIIVDSTYGILMTAEVGEEGNYSLSFPVLFTGNFVVQVNYTNHTTNYTSSINTSSVIVKTRSTNMTIINNETILVGQNVTIKGILLDELDEPIPNRLLNISIGEHKEEVQVEDDGTYYLEYQLDTVGTHEITVTFEGSTAYIGSINTSSVNVNPRSTNMTIVNNDTIFAGQNVSITGVLSDELDFTVPDTFVNITIGSFPKQEVRVNSEGVYSLNYTINEAGTFEIIVEYNNHTSNYTSSVNTSSVTVNPRSTNMTIVNEPTIISNTTLTITGVLTDELDDIIPETSVNIKIGTHEINNVRVDENGVYTTQYLIESAGEYVITVEYINSTTKYLSSTNTSHVSVTKRPTITNVSLENATFGNVTIIVNVTDSYNDTLVNTGNFTVYDSFGNKLNITDISVYGNNVLVNLSSSITKAGPIQISVGYETNDIYIGSNAINETSTNPSTTYLFEINVEKLDSTITVKVNTTNTTIGENVTINGTLTDSTGNNLTDADVTVTVDGQNITVKTDNKGQYTINYTTIKTGNITVTATFDGGDNYNPSNSETSFNVTLIPTITKAEFVNSTIGNVVINVNVTNSSDSPVGKGHVKVYDNQTGVLLGEGDLVNGGVNITLSVTAPGHLGVNVTYGSNDVYNSSNAIGNIDPESNITETDVDQLSSTVVLNVVPSDLIIGEAVQISGNVFDSNGMIIAEGKVNVTINGTNTTVDVKEGYYNLTYIPDIAGTYPMNATFLGNTNVSSSISENKGFTVNKMQTITSISVLNKTYGNVVVEVRVTNSTGAPVTTGFVDVVYENGTLIKRVNLEEEGVTGVVNVSITTTSLDNILVNASYVENRLYSASVARGNPQAPGKENTTLITVEALTPIIVIDLDKDNVTIGDTVTIKGTAIDNMGNPLPSGTIINISIGNNIEKVSVEGDEGKFSLAYITSSEGTFIVNATHGNVISNNLEFTVNKIATTTNVTIINNTVGNVTLNISVAGKDNKVITEGKVNITIAGDTPIVVDLTGESTIVELLNNITTTGLFYVNVEYTGNDTYLPSTALDTATGEELKNITVTPRNTSITVNTDILISDIGQNVRINGTLVDEMNNPIANATIIISVGGSNFTAKTGEDGKYALDYVASVLGNNSVVAVFEGNENYNPSNNETSFNVTKISTITSIESLLSNKVGNVTLVVNVTNATGELVGTGYVEVIDAETGELLGEGILKGDGKINITLTGVTEPGFIKVNVTYVENDHYYSSNAPGNTSGEENTTTMRVYGSPSISIKLSENNVTIGDKVTVQVNVTNDLGEQITEAITVNVSINGTDYNAVYNDTSGYYEVEYQTITAGEFPVNATYSYDDGSVTSETLSFTVNKIPTKTEVQIMNNTAGNVTINVAITNATDNPITTGFFNVTVAGKTRTVEVKDVNTTVTLDVANAGNVSVSVKYLEGDVYAESIGINNETQEELTNITVVKQKTGLTLNINPNDTFIGKTVTISGVLVDGFDNPVGNALITIKVNSTEYLTKTGSDGSYSINNVTVANGTIPVQVFYDGNETLDKVNTTGSFKVNKIPTVTLVSVVNDTAGNVSIAVKVIDVENNPVRSGQFTVTYEGATTSVPVSGDVTNIPLKLYTNGTFILKVEYYDKNDVYINSTGLNETLYPGTIEIVKNIAVHKQNTTLSVDVITPVKAGNKTVISGILLDEQGKAIPDVAIQVRVGDKDVGSTFTGSDGSYTFEFDETVVGTHTVTGYYEGNGTYNQSSNTATLVVVHTNTSISINPLEYVTIGNIVNITGKLVDEFNNPLGGAAVKVTFDTDSRDVITNMDGTFNASFTASSVGNKNVKVEFAGNNTHTASNDTSQVQVVPVVAIITSTLPSDAKVGDTKVINGSVTDKDGNPLKDVPVNVTVNGKIYPTKTGSDGKYNVSVNNTISGLNNVTVSAGNENVTAENLTDKFIVDKKTTNIIINQISDVPVGENVTITGTLTDEDGNKVANATIRVKVGNEEKTVRTDKDGKYNASLVADEGGPKLVNVYYDGNDTFDGSDESGMFEVTKKSGSVTVNIPSNAHVGDTVNVTGTLKDEDGKALAGEPVEVKVNGKTFTRTTDGNGNYKVPVNNLEEGTNYISVTVPSSRVNVQPVEKNLTVTKKKTNITIQNLRDVPLGTTTTITGTLTDENKNKIANATVRVKVGNEEKTVRTDKDGKYNASFTTSSIGSKLVNVYYDGNDTFEGSDESGMFEVTKKSGSVTVNIQANAHVGDTVNVTGTLKDEGGKALAGEPVEVKVNGKTYTKTTDGNGNYKVPVNNLEEGTNYISVTVPSSRVNVQPVEKNLTVTKKKTNITIQNLRDVPLGTTTTITGTLTDENKNKIANATVRVKVGNGEKTVRTDKDGKYNASFTTSSIGSKLVNVYYDGNDTFEGSDESGMFEVTKKSGSVTVNIQANAHVGDTVNVTGTLKDEGGKALAGEPVEVKVNGKTYTTTTDKNGNYAVPVNNLEDGTNYISVSVPSSKVSAPPVEKSFTITKKNTRITVQNIPNVPVGTTVAITGTLTDEAGKVVPNADISVTVNGMTETVKSDSNGKYTLNYPTTTVKQENVAVMYVGNQTLNGSSNSTRFNVVKANATLTVNKVNATSLNDNITVTGRLVDKNNKPIANAPVTITVNGENKTVTTDAMGNYKLPVENAVNGKNNVTVKFGNDKFNTVTMATDFTLRKLKTTVVVESVIGTIGEDITLVARVTDENGNNVSGGNLVFKLNGRSLREDGRFDTNTSNPLKLKVKDGLVTFTMKADLYLRNGKNLTASYSGSNKYEEAKGNVAIANIRKRTSQVTVTVTPKMAKQNTDVIFTATLTDVTKNAKNTTCLSTNGTIIFKVNGKTLKDKNGKVIRLNVTRDVVNYAYHIDRGTAGIDNNKTLRNYTVEAVYDNELFYPDARNTTVYNVERSPVNIKFTKTSVQSNMLSVKATIKDYEGINVVGNTKICIKINGVTYTENGKAKYFTIKNGNVDLSGIKLSSGTTVKSVMIVAGETSAYLTARETTTEITTT